MTLYPASWTPGSSSIAIGQSSSADVLAQDVLTRKEDTPVNPAHILGENEAIQLKHAHSMIDFILKDLDFTDITKIDVLVGSTTYAAYPAIDTSDKKEYLLILPPGTKDNPVIKITTTDSRTYTQTIKIVGDKRTEYGVNTCYCFTLKGIELKLSPITITNWSTGEALEGDYVGVTEYPTFRGPAGKSYELYFDNHLTDTSGNELWQKITFNSRGECTVKPYGRTIIKIRTCGTTPVKERSVNVILREMVIDLNSYISSL